MGWSNASRSGTIKLEIDEDKVRELLDDKDFEVDEIVCEDFEITFCMKGRTFYEPAVMTLSNGDPGYPAEYYEEFPLDEDDTEWVEKIFGGLFKAKIELDDPETEEDEPW